MNRQCKAPLAALLSVALAGAVDLMAQPVEVDRTAPEPTMPPGGRPAAPIDGARKDFEAVKSLRDYGVEARGELPRVSVPNVPAGAAPMLPNGPVKRLDAGKQSPTWLVDAMRKDAPARGARGSDERARERGEKLIEDREPGEKPEREERRDQRPLADDDSARQERNRAPNPFANYLGAWLSPQDLALLKPTFERSYARESFRPDMRAGRPAGDESTVGQGSGGLVPLPRNSLATPGINAPVTARENPYLEVVGSASPATLPQSIAPKGNAAAASASTGGIPSTTQIPPTVPTSKIPDFVRPNSDERYFKQLKRF